MKGKVVIAFVILSILNPATSITINCDFQTATNFYIVGQVYTCIIKSVSHPENKHVTITGTHASGKINDDVIGIYGTNFGSLQVFPKGLGEVFKNLKAIYTRSSGMIREIHQEDLKDMPNLVEFLMYGNLIEVLEGGLFDYNLKLEAISFYSNPVRIIGTAVFDNLQNLRYFWLNGCANIFTENNRGNVLYDIIRAKSLCIDKNCPEPSSSIKSGKDLLAINEKLDYLKNKLLEMDAKYDNLTQRIGNFESVIKQSIKDEGKSSGPL